MGVIYIVYFLLICHSSVDGNPSYKLCVPKALFTLKTVDSRLRGNDSFYMKLFGMTTSLLQIAQILLAMQQECVPETFSCFPAAAPQLSNTLQQAG